MEKYSQKQVRKKWKRLLKASRNFDPSFAPDDILAQDWEGFRKGDHLLNDVLGWFLDTYDAGLAVLFVTCSDMDSEDFPPNMMRLFAEALQVELLLYDEFCDELCDRLSYYEENCTCLPKLDGCYE